MPSSERSSETKREDSASTESAEERTSRSQSPRAEPPSCDLCGWRPATALKLHSVTGLVLFWRWHTIELTCCRSCGTAAYNECQRQTLLKGWWGIVAPAATLVAFVGNFKRFSVIRDLGEPRERHPRSNAPWAAPAVGSKPWWKRPMSLIATAVVLLTAYLYVDGLLKEFPSPPNSSSSVPADSSGTPNVGESGYLGSCWRLGTATQATEVGCATGGSLWRVVREIPSANGAAACGSRPSLIAEEWYLCLDAM